MENDLIRLLEGKTERILFVGIGNVLRKDDGIGVYTARQIKESGRIMKLLAEVSLENYISKINRMQADEVVLIDCIDFGREPGYWALLPVELTDGPALQSHHLSLAKLKEFFAPPIQVLGIQPADIGVGERLHASVKEAGDRIASIISAYSTLMFPAEIIH